MTELIVFLSTPAGQEVTHAIVVVAVAISGWLNWRTHREAQRNGRLLNGHLADHMRQSENAAASSETDDEHNM